MHIKFIGFFCVVLSMHGCMSLSAIRGEKSGHIFDRDGVDAIAVPSTTSIMYFKSSASNERYCLAPGPDYSVTASGGGNTSIMGKHLSGGATEAALSLGGRSPSLLVVREIMYRACELAMNLNATAEDSKLIYFNFLLFAKGLAAVNVADQGTPSSITSNTQSVSSYGANDPSPASSPTNNPAIPVVENTK